MHVKFNDTSSAMFGQHVATSFAHARCVAPAWKASPGVCQVALDAARGLAYLHSRRIAHLDIKSANVLLTREGKAKISDVGLARVVQASPTTTPALTLHPAGVSLGRVLRMPCPNPKPQLLFGFGKRRLWRAARRPATSPAWMPRARVRMPRTKPTHRVQPLLT